VSPLVFGAAYDGSHQESTGGIARLLAQFPAADFQQADSLPSKPRNAVYLIVIGWMYVVLMMSVAEASSTTGTLLGAIVTFFLYGLLPVALVVYLMRTPQRRKEIKAREAAERMASQSGFPSEERSADAPYSAQPDAGGHAPGAAAANGIAPVGKKM
jgi:hypothetical protein